MAKKPKPIRAVVPRVAMPLGVIFRMFVIGAISVGGAGYAIYRYYFERPARSVAPAPAATEVEAPELEK